MALSVSVCLSVLPPSPNFNFDQYISLRIYSHFSTIFLVTSAPHGHINFNHDVHACLLVLFVTDYVSSAPHWCMNVDHDIVGSKHISGEHWHPLGVLLFQDISEEPRWTTPCPHRWMTCSCHLFLCKFVSIRHMKRRCVLWCGATMISGCWRRTMQASSSTGSRTWIT